MCKLQPVKLDRRLRRFSILSDFKIARSYILQWYPGKLVWPNIMVRTYIRTNILKCNICTFIPFPDFPFWSGTVFQFLSNLLLSALRYRVFVSYLIGSEMVLLLCYYCSDSWWILAIQVAVVFLGTTALLTCGQTIQRRMPFTHEFRRLPTDLLPANFP